MTNFRLRVAEDEVRDWYLRYEGDALTPAVEKVVLRVRRQGYLTKPDFLTICRWKTPRSQSRCQKNSPEFIKAVSQTALSTNNERLRIEAWTLLDGVNWPTASTLLHWLHTEEYPILDFRALWSLGYKRPPRYTCEFWWDYVRFCRRLAKRTGLSVRNLDRALWQYSRERQK